MSYEYAPENKHGNLEKLIINLKIKNGLIDNSLNIFKKIAHLID